jgi:hypothetical protein
MQFFKEDPSERMQYLKKKLRQSNATGEAMQPAEPCNIFLTDPGGAMQYFLTDSGGGAMQHFFTDPGGGGMQHFFTDPGGAMQYILTDPGRAM